MADRLNRSLETAVAGARASIVVPATSRDGVLRQIAGVQEHGNAAAVNTVQVADLHRSSSRAASVMDSGAAVVQHIRALRDQQADVKLSERALDRVSGEILATLPVDERQAVIAVFPQASAMRDALRTLMVKLLAAPSPTAAIVARTQQEQLQLEARQPKQAEQEPTEEELLATGLAPTAAKGFLSRVLSGAENMWRAISSVVARAVSGAVRAVREVLEKTRRTSRREEPAPTSTSFVTPTLDPAAGRSLPLQPQKLSDEWRDRFSDDPAEGVKKSVDTVVRVLEEYAAGKRRESMEEQFKCEEEHALERDRMNKLRESLARLLVPMNDGNIPLALLSRHFVGPWLTEEDLLAAIDRARQARSAPDRQAA